MNKAFWFYGCITKWIKALEQLQGITQNLDPCGLTSRKRLPPVRDHIYCRHVGWSLTEGSTAKESVAKTKQTLQRKSELAMLPERSS